MSRNTSERLTDKKDSIIASQTILYYAYTPNKPYVIEVNFTREDVKAIRDHIGRDYVFRGNNFSVNLKHFAACDFYLVDKNIVVGD